MLIMAATGRRRTAAEAGRDVIGIRDEATGERSAPAHRVETRGAATVRALEVLSSSGREHLGAAGSSRSRDH